MCAEAGDGSAHYAFEDEPAAIAAQTALVDGARTRLLLLALAALLVVLVSPLLAGYAGPRAAVYVSTWRPWRQSMSVRVDTAPAIPAPTRTKARFIVHYDDASADGSSAPGSQIVWVTVARPHPLLPWIVAEISTGP